MEDFNESDYGRAVEFLMSIPRFTHEPTLDTAALLLEMLGNPEKGRKTVHVAGTNGKGSVCAYIDSVLRVKGSRVGLFTSPHLVRMEERIRINGSNVSREQFMEAFLAVRECDEAIAKRIGRLTFFEYLFGMAMYCFGKADTEYIVLETGLGGRLDATNAVTSPCVTVITPVSYDHMAVLGDTIEQIAAEKAGIIKSHVPVVFWAENEGVRGVITQTAERLCAPCFPVGKGDYEIFKNSNKSVDFCIHNRYYKNGRFSVPFPAPYQAGNAMLAIQALGCLSESDSQITYETVAEGIKNTRWQGRFEEVAPGIIVDGAHNEDGIKSFLETVAAVRTEGRTILLFMAMKDKDYHSMVRLLCTGMRFDEVIVTQNGKERCLLASELKAEFERYTDKPVTAAEDFESAFSMGRDMLKEGDRLYCVGSLYLVGAVLEEYGR